MKAVKSVGAMLLAAGAVLSLSACGGSTKATSPNPQVSGVHSAYVANAGSNNISEYAIDDKGILHEITGSPFAANISPAILTMTPNGNFLYAIDPSKNTIAEMSINSTSGVLTSIGTQTSGPSPTSASIDPKGKFLYVGNSGASSFSVYSIGSDGKLTEASFSPVAVNGPVKGISVSPKGTYLFASVPSTASLYEFALDSTSGTPTISAGSPMTVGTNPIFTAISPDETFAIVLDATGTINRLNIDSAGALTVAAFSPFTANSDPTMAIIDSSNTYVYILNSTADTMTSLGFQSSGAPYQITRTVLGKIPAWFAVSGTYVYAVNSTDNTVSEFSLSAGATTELSTPTVTTGTTPVSIAIR